MPVLNLANKAAVVPPCLTAAQMWGRQLTRLTQAPGIWQASGVLWPGKSECKLISGFFFFSPLTLGFKCWRPDFLSDLSMMQLWGHTSSISQKVGTQENHRQPVEKLSEMSCKGNQNQACYMQLIINNAVSVMVAISYKLQSFLTFACWPIMLQKLSSNPQHISFL